EMQTGEFLVKEISHLIENIGSEKFAAIITDAASNCKFARKKIQEFYPHIWDIRCAAHAINLIASDLVKLENVKDLINK
ncbi:7080_t:CDS:1, partial [Acaulospora morrowiae]